MIQKCAIRDSMIFENISFKVGNSSDSLNSEKIKHKNFLDIVSSSRVLKSSKKGLGLRSKRRSQI